MLLLDTQAWVWWTGQHKRLTRVARNRIVEADAIGISAVSIAEAVYAVRRGRLKLDRPLDEWLALAVVAADLQVVAFDAALAQQAGSLDWTHGDPMDRAVVATAIAHRAALISSDGKIRGCELLEVVWK